MPKANAGNDAEAINPDQQADTTDDQTTADIESIRPRRSRGIDLESIADKRAAERDAEMVEKGFQPIDTRPDPEDDPAAPAPDAAAQVAAKPPAPTPAPATEPPAAPPPVIEELLDAEYDTRKVTLMIDGEQVTTTLAQLKRDAQKSAAADKRLKEANALLEQARATAAKTVDRVPASSAPAAAPSNQTSSKERSKAYSKALYEGNDDEAAAMFDAAVDARVEARFASYVPPTQVDARQVAVEVNQLRDQESALQEVAAEYPLAQSNEFTAAAANRFYTEAKAEGLDEAAAIRAAAEKTYETFGYTKQTAKAPTPATTPRSERAIALKGSLDIPAGRSVSAAKVDDTPTSSEGQRSAAIAEIARRGRPIAGR